MRAYVEGTELEVWCVCGRASVAACGRWPHRRLLWLLVGLIAAAGTAIALDRAVFSGSQADSSAPKDVQNRVQALVRGSIPGALLFVRQGDRSYTVTAGYAEKANKTPMRAGDTFPINYTWPPKQIVAFAATSPLAFAPGTKFSYSNTNYVVLALLAERVGGKSYEKQLADYMFAPLKLDHTSLPPSNKTLPDVHGYVGVAAHGKADGAGNFDSAALTPAFGWSAGGIRATAEDEADFFRGLFSGKLLPAAQVAAMEDTSATGGAYGLGLMPTGGHESAWRAFTRTITTTCGRAWGHGGAFPGHYQLPISSPDGSRQAVLLVNTEEALLSPAQYKQVYSVLATAYCRGVTS